MGRWASFLLWHQPSEIFRGNVPENLKEVLVELRAPWHFRSGASSKSKLGEPQIEGVRSFLQWLVGLFDFQLPHSEIYTVICDHLCILVSIQWSSGLTLHFEMAVALRWTIAIATYVFHTACICMYCILQMPCDGSHYFTIAMYCISTLVHFARFVCSFTLFHNP